MVWVCVGTEVGFGFHVPTSSWFARGCVGHEKSYDKGSLEQDSNSYWKSCESFVWELWSSSKGGIQSERSNIDGLEMVDEVSSSVVSCFGNTNCCIHSCKMGWSKHSFFIGFWMGGLLCGAGCSWVWATFLLLVATWTIARHTSPQRQTSLLQNNPTYTSPTPEHSAGLHPSSCSHDCMSVHAEWWEEVWDILVSLHDSKDSGMHN